MTPAPALLTLSTANRLQRWNPRLNSGALNLTVGTAIGTGWKLTIAGGTLENFPAARPAITLSNNNNIQTQGR